MSTVDFRATATLDLRNRVMLPVPFDPDEVWGPRQQHRVVGTVNGVAVQGVIEPLGIAGRGLLLVAAVRRESGIGPGDEVTAALEPDPL